MAAALIGNIMMSNIRTSISSATATGVTSDSNQVLASNILANPTLGSGNYTFQWSQSGTTITFTAATSNSTNCTYGSLSVSGSTTIFCTVTDTWTGVKSVTSNCVITWPVQTITQNIVISGSPTYNGSGQAYTLTASTGPAPTGSPASFTNAGTYTYPTNITSITPSAGYVIGTVTGSFTIAKKQLTITGGPGGPVTITNCGGYGTQTMTCSYYPPDPPPSCQGLVGGDTSTGTLTAYNGGPDGLTLIICPVSTNDSSTINAVASGGTNPKTGLSNGANSIIMCAPGNTNPPGPGPPPYFPDHYYWFVFGSTSSNYLSSTAVGNNFSCGT
jgi:hypothetical protein